MYLARMSNDLASFFVKSVFKIYSGMYNENTLNDRISHLDSPIEKKGDVFAHAAPLDISIAAGLTDNWPRQN